MSIYNVKSGKSINLPINLNGSFSRCAYFLTNSYIENKRAQMHAKILERR